MKADSLVKLSLVERTTCLNHLFIDGIGSSKPTEYRKLANIDRQVLKDIQQWMMQPK